MANRQHLHVLVDELPEGELVAAKRFLEFLGHRSQDPLRILLDKAPLDDEAVTEEDLAAIREGREDKARGDVLSQDEVERLLLEAP
jgi:predicted transcriptional regulator